MHSFVRPAVCLAAALLLAAAAGTPAGAILRADTVPVTGEAEGLYPGASVELIAMVANPYSFPIRVMSIDATPIDGGACPTSMVSVTGSTVEVTVEPGASGGVPLRVHLDRDAGDECQGVTFTVEFTGTIVEAVPGSAPVPSAGGPLAFTGGSVVGPLVAGGAMVGLGAVALRRSRRIAR